MCFHLSPLLRQSSSAFSSQCPVYCPRSVLLGQTLSLIHADFRSSSLGSLQTVLSVPSVVPQLTCAIGALHKTPSGAFCPSADLSLCTALFSQALSLLNSSDLRPSGFSAPFSHLREYQAPPEFPLTPQLGNPHLSRLDQSQGSHHLFPSP